MDSTGIESVFEIRWAKRKDHTVEDDDDINIHDLPELNINESSFDILKDNVLYYICGFIVKQIFKKIDCVTCANSLLEVPSIHNYCHKQSYSVLVDLKNRGGLVKSSADVMKIVRFIEIILIKFTNNFSTLKSCLTSKIINHSKNHAYNSNIFKNLNCEDDSFLENHKLNLVTLICKQYLKIRLHYAAKLKTASNVSKRRMYTKLILFQNV